MAIAKIVDDEQVNYFGKSTENVSKVGKMILGEVFNRDEYKSVAEKFEQRGIKKEDLTLGNNDVLYTTAVAGFIEKAFTPKLLTFNLIKKVTDFKLKGFNSVKITLSKLLVAQELPDTGSITFPSDVDYGKVEIEIKWVYASQRLTYQLIQQSALDIVADRLAEIGDAIARKVDSDIISAIDSACTSANGNVSSLGSGTYISYDALVDAIATHKNLNAEPSVILTNPTTWARIMKDADVKQALAFGTSSAQIMPQAQQLFGCKLLTTTQVPENTTYLLDTSRLGYFIDASNIQTYDGRVSGNLVFEVVGVKAYGVGIVRPESVYKIVENA